MFRKHWWILPLFTVMLFLVPDIASAHPMGALTTVQTDLQQAITKWDSPLQAAAKNLFYVFAAIEIAILAMNHGLRQKGHDDLFNSLIRKVVVLGFFMTCIDNAPQWANAIITGLEGGVSAIGVTVVTPSTIAGFAEKAFMAIWLAPIHAADKDASSILDDVLSGNWGSAFSAATSFFAATDPVSLIAEMILTFVIGLLTFISIMMLALELLMVTLESYLVIAFGVIVLAGGGLRYTAKYVSSYFDYAINVGFRLLMINAIAYLVADPSSSFSLVTMMTNMMKNVTNPLQMAIQVLALGAIMALLPKKASSIATSILTGSSSFSGGELGKGMATAGVGAAAIAAAPVALAAAGGAAGAGAFSAAAGSAGGGGGALMGATEAAQAGGAAAQGGAGSMSAGMGSSGGGAGSMESASMKSVPTPDAKGMEHMRASVQKPSASGSSTNSKSNDAPQSAENTGKITEGSAAGSSPSAGSPSAGSEGSSSGGGESPIAEAGEAAGVAGLTAEAVAHATPAAQGASAAQGGASAAKATSGASTAAPAAKGAPAAQASGSAASTAGSSAPAGSALSAGPSQSAGPSGGPAGDSSASGGGESSGDTSEQGTSEPSTEAPSDPLPRIDAKSVPAPSPSEQTEMLRQIRDSLAQQNRQPSLTEQANKIGKRQMGNLVGDTLKDHGKDTGGVSGSKLDFKHMDD